jgi:aldehyde dehydrogenase (NAD+)
VVNNCIIHLANDGLPFGGIGESGLGNYHGLFGFKTFSHERAVMYQGKPAAVSMFYPPYTDKVKKLVGFMTSYLSR